MLNGVPFINVDAKGGIASVVNGFMFNGEPFIDASGGVGDSPPPSSGGIGTMPTSILQAWQAWSDVTPLQVIQRKLVVPGAGDSSSAAHRMLALF